MCTLVNFSALSLRFGTAISHRRCWTCLRCVNTPSLPVASLQLRRWKTCPYCARSCLIMHLSMTCPTPPHAGKGGDRLGIYLIVEVTSLQLRRWKTCPYCARSCLIMHLSMTCPTPPHAGKGGDRIYLIVEVNPMGLIYWVNSHITPNHNLRTVWIYL